MKLLHAFLLLGVLSFLFGYVVLVLTGQCKDNLGGPTIGIVSVLAVLLSVGLTERIAGTHTHKFDKDFSHEDD